MIVGTSMQTEGRSCCPSKANKKKFDFILWGSLSVLVLAIGGYEVLSQFGSAPHWLHHFAHASTEILLMMWWGIALGIIIVGIMSKVPRDFFTAIMGRSDNFGGLLRAVTGGVLLDLCCHGILLVAAKLYERGVSYPQVVTFLVASPWNSVSLTLILIGLIGLKWTLLYILGSVVIALFTGFILQLLVKAGKIPDNPHAPDINENYDLKAELKRGFQSFSLSKSTMLEILRSGWRDGKMIIKWLLFGTIIAASLRAFVPPDVFASWLGPTVAGLFFTLLMATIVEICSEGSAPVAGEIVMSANAPGNGFTFLMAGVATDYTELMAVREFTKSWVLAFAIPLITVPQVLLIGWIMNLAAVSGGG
ncbi:MAG: ATPase [Alphaproteobacteria bacterium]|nr:ATPase [Alphaproteobacteria bacterium]